MREPGRPLLRAALLGLVPAETAEAKIDAEAIFERRARDRPPALLAIGGCADEDVAEAGTRGELEIQTRRGAFVLGHFQPEKLGERPAMQLFDRTAEGVAEA